MYRHIAAGLLALAVCGCVHCDEPATAPTAPVEQALSPDEAKAVLIARAAVESMISGPSNFLTFDVRPEEDGWHVFVSPIERPRMGRGVCVVVIDRDWKVVRIDPGA